MTTYIFCYAVFFLLTWVSKISDSLRLIDDEGAFTTKPGNLIGSHLIGILWLGAVPVVLLNKSVLKILAGDQMPEITYVLLYIVLFSLIITIAIKQSEKLIAKKQVPVDAFLKLSPTFFTWYFIIRALFLFVYELWFRGFLLFDCISWVGTPAAVAINVFLYVLVHMFNSKKEILACIPFGILVCLLCIFFNAAWPAIILHIGFSLVYELNVYRSYFYSSKTVSL